MKKTTIIGIIVILVAAGIAYNGYREAPPAKQATLSSNSTTTPATGLQSRSLIVHWPALTLTEVVKHATAADCWTTVNGSVYDLTSWVADHPGGREAILYICGKDGSVAFNGKHGGQDKPAAALASFKIGSLKP
ncbi:MAG: cytochrome b5-like heme/steroid binding domain-containing protein [Candidatus Paceibacterota bacterium]